MKRLFSSWAVAALLCTMPLMTACADQPEAPDYEARVNESLETAQLADVDANWNQDEGALRLSGEVQNAADRARAEELARQVVGTSGRVVNEVKVAGMETETVDDQIEDTLGRMFEDRTEWDFDGRGVTFDSEAGVVTITGTVETQDIKNRIGEHARKTEGVKDVVNNLEVEPKG